MSRGKSDQRGFTLVELMVSMAMAAILAMSLIQIVAPVYRTYRRTLNRADAQMIAENVLDSIRKSAIRAGKVTANGDGTGVDVGSGVYWVKGGGLVFTASPVNGTPSADQPVFDPKYYNGKAVALSAVSQPGTGDTVVEVTVTVSGSDGELCSLNGVISTLRGVLTSGTP